MPTSARRSPVENPAAGQPLPGSSMTTPSRSAGASAPPRSCPRVSAGALRLALKPRSPSTASMSPALPLAIGSRDDALDVLVVEERRRARDELRIRADAMAAAGLSTRASAYRTLVPVHCCCPDDLPSPNKKSLFTHHPLCYTAVYSPPLTRVTADTVIRDPDRASAHDAHCHEA